MATWGSESSLIKLEAEMLTDCKQVKAGQQ